MVDGPWAAICAGPDGPHPRQREHGLLRLAVWLRRSLFPPLASALTHEMMLATRREKFCANYRR